MSLNWRLNRWDAYQSRLECLDGREHNDISWQLVPNPNSSKEETVIKGINTPSWNTELSTVSCRILSVWSQIQWCRYCDKSIDNSVHHHSSGLISMYFQCIPNQLLHHKSWTSFAARRTSRLTELLQYARRWIMFLQCVTYTTWQAFIIYHFSSVMTNTRS